PRSSGHPERRLPAHPGGTASGRSRPRALSRADPLGASEGAFPSEAPPRAPGRGQSLAANGLLLLAFGGRRLLALLFELAKLFVLAHLQELLERLRGSAAAPHDPGGQEDQQVLL